MFRNFKIEVVLAVSIATSTALTGCLVGEDIEPEAELGVVKVMGHGLELEYLRGETSDGEAAGLVGDMLFELPDQPFTAREGSLPTDDESILGVRSP